MLVEFPRYHDRDYVSINPVEVESVRRADVAAPVEAARITMRSGAIHIVSLGYREVLSRLNTD